MQGYRSFELASSAETTSNSLDRESESILAFRHVATEYLTTHAPKVQEYLSHLHENDLNHEIVLAEQPDYAIYIPIAANESEQNIRSTLDALIKRPFQRPEIFLYGNYTKDTSADEIVELDARLNRIMDDYRQTPTFSSLRSVTVPTYYYHHFSMVQLRKEITDMIAADALQRGLPFNYPVVSLDADVLRLSPTTLESLVTPIKDEGVTLTYGDSNDGYRDVPDHASTRLAITAEIMRRMEVRHATENPYPEESCTAFSLGAYCMAKGYPPLIQNDYDKSNLIGETPILIKRMEMLHESSTYIDILDHILGRSPTDVAPRHVTGATVTRNGRRNLEYFINQLEAAQSNPEKFADTTRLLQEVMQAKPTLDRHIATGGAYNEGFSNQEKMRETNGTPASLTIPSRRVLELILRDYFGPTRMGPEDPFTNKGSASDQKKLRLQQQLLRRYFDITK